MELIFEPKNLAKVKIGEVRPNSWNPKDRESDEHKREYERVVASIEENGQRLPIVVRENRGYEIIDGEQRWTAMVDLGFKECWVYNEGEIDDKRAKALTIWYQTQTPFDRIKEVYLATELTKAGVSLPYTENELVDFEELTKFNWDDYEFNRVEDVEFETIFFRMHKDQAEIVYKALDSVKEQDLDMTKERGLELICADFLGGA